MDEVVGADSDKPSDDKDHAHPLEPLEPPAKEDGRQNTLK